MVNLCDSITNNTSSLDHVLDMDRIMWMLAFNNVLINLDSYSGVFAQNHYTYLDNTGHFNPIIWDLNMAFGAFPFAGLGGTSMGNLNAIQMQQFSTANHASDTNWPLINAIQANPSWKKKYIAHMRTMLNEQFINHNYLTTANQLRGMIDTAVDSDNNKFFTYLQFQQSMDSSVDVGSYDVPGIKTLMAARSTYLQSTPEFSALPPVISAIASNPASPAIHTNTNISLTVTNATPSSVMIGYRFDKTQKFIKAIMFDDGMHNDGAANDNQYGLSINMLGGTMQYYFYAENNDAGLFAPERAEHEYYTLHATSQIPVTGQLVINELLADNVTHEQDEYGNTEDWIEIYNNSTSLLDLSNLYLSDDLNNLMKWKFPSNTSLPPNEYLMIWADDDSSQQIYHTNFQLNKDSAILILTNSTSLILDSISFKAQNTNISYGRYPNGTGNFIPMNTTFGSINNNYPLLLNQHSKQNSFLIYPNPSSESVHLVFHGEQNIQIFTVQGRLIYAGKANGHATIYTDQWDNGIYFVKCDHQIQKMIIHHP